MCKFLSARPWNFHVGQVYDVTNQYDAFGFAVVADFTGDHEPDLAVFKAATYTLSFESSGVLLRKCEPFLQRRTVGRLLQHLSGNNRAKPKLR